LHRFALRLLALSAFALAAIPASATATVNQTNITTPGDPSFLTDNQDDSAPATFHIEGDAPGAADTDTVDIRCYGDGSYQSVVSGLPVSGGHFATTGASGANPDPAVNSITYQTCVLRAVRSGFGGDSVSAFNGPRIGSVSLYKNANYVFTTAPNAGKINDFYAEDNGLLGYVDFYSYSSCGLDYGEPYFGGNAFNEANDGVWDCNMYPWFRGDGETPGVSVDGHPAYTAYGAARIDSNGNDSTVPGIQGLTWTPSVDPLTGDLTITEHQPLMFCTDAADAVVDTLQSYGTNGCDHYTDAGVAVDRTIKTSGSASVVRMSDNYRSTTGTGHKASILYEEDFDGSPSFKFPGSGSFETFDQYATAGPPAAVPASIIVNGARDYPDQSNEAGQGAITVNNAWDSADFYGENGFYFAYRNRDVPATGAMNIEHVYSMATSQDAVGAKARSAEDGFQGPAVSITSPANGATTPTQPVTVTGKATDNVGVTSLTLNGGAVTPGADGSFSAPVALTAGQNTITAVAKDAAGNSSQAAINVVYAPPAPKTCKVPKLKKHTLAAAKKAIKKAGCVVGKIKAKKSKTIKPGRVISQSVKAGKRVKIGTKINLTASKKKAPAHKK
jgi:hypothetical protein